MKSYSPEIYQLIARNLAGECSPEESGRLNDLIANDPDLKAEYEISQLLFPDRCKENADEYTRSRFERLSHRLKDDGLI